jgi:hypothetical protein
MKPPLSSVAQIRCADALGDPRAFDKSETPSSNGSSASNSRTRRHLKVEVMAVDLNAGELLAVAEADRLEWAGGITH